MLQKYIELLKKVTICMVRIHLRAIHFYNITMAHNQPKPSFFLLHDYPMHNKG